MSTADLSRSTQDYLKVIWNLQEWSDVPVTSSAIADRLHLRLSTVSDGIRKLAESGLVDHAPYGHIALTPQGRAHALAMVRRHRLLESFLFQVLDYTWDEVHEEAEHLEHSASDEMIERIDRLLGHPTRDPHGDPIPSRDGQPHTLDARMLREVRPPAAVIVERVSDVDSRLLRFFARNGLEVGAAMDVLPHEDVAEVMAIRVRGQEATLHLGFGAASAVWVSMAKDAGPGENGR